MADFQRIGSTTLRDFGRGYEDAMMREQAMPALMKDADRLSFGHSGDGFDWALKFKRAVPVGNRGDRPLTFLPVNRFQRPKLAYRGFVSTDVMPLLEFHANRGKPALINYFNEMAENLFDDNGRKMSQQWWNNGNATSDPDSFHGNESFFGQAGTSVNHSTGAIRSYDQSDFVIAPSDTYAGLNTDLGYYGGTGGITGQWPNNFQATNDGDTFDFNSGVMVNYESSSFSGAVHDWAHQGEQSIRFLLNCLVKDSSKNGIANVVLLAPDLWRQLKDFYGPAQRIDVTNSKLRKLGFNDTLQIDGTDVRAEFGIPPGVGYAFNVNQMQFRSMFKTMFFTQGPTYHMESQSWRVACNALGNIKHSSPKYFGKLGNYNTVPTL